MTDARTKDWLLRTHSEARGATADLADLCAAEVPLSAHAGWTLIGAARHLERQRWLAGLVPTLRTLGDSGVIPAAPGWQYEFQDLGISVVNESGTEIHLDLVVDGGRSGVEEIDVSFWQRHLETLPQPELPEERLLAIDPHLSTVRLAIAELADCGLAALRSGRSRFRLTAAGEDAAAPLLRLAANSGSVLRLHLLLGDWDAQPTNAEPRLEALLRSRASQARQQRLAWLRKNLSDESRRPDALRQYVRLGADDLDDELRRSLGSSADVDSLRVTLEILNERADPGHVDAVRRAAQTLDASRNFRDSGALLLAVRYLLTHAPSDSTAHALLDRLHPGHLADAAMLTLELAPDLAAGPLRRGVESDSAPFSRVRCAALLRLLGQPWCESILQELQHPDEEAIAEAMDELRPVVFRLLERRNERR